MADQPDPEVLELALIRLKEECGDDQAKFEALVPKVIADWQSGGGEGA